MDRVIELFTEIQKNVSDLEDALKNLKHRKCAISYEDMEKYGLAYKEPKDESPIVRFNGCDFKKELDEKKKLIP